MTNFEYGIILHWIGRNIKPTNKINESHTSYGLKDMCEKDLDTYISNDDFKFVMENMGYAEFASYTQGNPYYKFKFTSENEKLGYDLSLSEITESELNFEIELNKEEKILRGK